MIQIDLAKKVVLVTGAGGGIGKGIAEVFGKAGARVYAADLNETAVSAAAQELSGKGYQIIGKKLDVTSKADIDMLVDEIVKTEGHIDVLINAAGILFSKPFMETTEEELWKTLNVNLVSVNNMCQSGLRYMIPCKSGKIVNVASIAARHGNDLLAHYSTSKYGEVGLTQSIALAVAADHINVNAICPGFIKTPLQEKLVEGRAKADGKTIEEAWAAQAARIPMRRFQSAEDVGNACLFLASDLAINITGQALNVCGGIRLN